MLLADYTTDPTYAHGMAGALAAAVTTFIVFGVGGYVIVAIPGFFIVKKAGFNGWLVLLTLIPLVNLVVLYVFAFSEWPALRGSRPLGFQTPPPWPQAETTPAQGTASQPATYGAPAYGVPTPSGPIVDQTQLPRENPSTPWQRPSDPGSAPPTPWA